MRHTASGGSSESFPPCRDMSPSIVLEPKRWRPAMYSVFTLHFCRMVVSWPSLVQLEGSGFDRAVMPTTGPKRRISGPSDLGQKRIALGCAWYPERNMQTVQGYNN